ncbi:EGF-like domain protein [Teladorsagia circumcincta]|uniref:EGF-like domain protein n=1 Tax=Teladorsagia circumcincta TaxID=45464 RepID=A0A2G9UI18_TELCI|nr:EGF-like domain protein [Teladorsagia circumcincta]
MSYGTLKVAVTVAEAVFVVQGLNATAEIVLLTVFDSSTGKKLAECSDVTGPVRGSVCIGEMEVQNMRFYGCPHHQELNSIASLNLDCSCPYDHDEHETVIHFPTDPPFPIFELEGTPQSPRQSVWTVGPCANFACLNNGTCVVAQEGTAACLCPDGFIGGNCEIDVCSTVPCQNGGHCKADGGEGRCVCPPEFTGILCESLERKDRDYNECKKLPHPIYTLMLDTRTHTQRSFRYR